MFQSVSITGLGPFEERKVFTLEPAGVTAFSEPSQWGKSTLARAICIALWGVDVDGTSVPVSAINDNAREMIVELTTATGTVIARTITKKRKQTRTIQRPNDAPLEYRNDAEFSRALKKLGHVVNVGKKVHPARLVLVPKAWRALLSSGGGRPLRDFFAAVLPMGDIRAHVAEIMAEAGAKLMTSDPVDARTVEGLRTKTGKHATHAEGACESAQHAVNTHADETPQNEVSAKQVNAAKVTLERDKSWTKYAQACEPWRKAEARASSWRAQREALGSVPDDWDASEYARLDSGVDSAQGFIGLRRQELDKANETHTWAKAKLEASKREVSAVGREIEEAAKRGDDCPKCGKKWSEATKARKALAGKLNGATTAREQAAQAVVDCAEAVDTKRKALEEAEGKVNAAKERRRSMDAGARVVDGLAKLGEVPPVPAKPTAPKWAQPSQEGVEAAWGIRERVKHQSGAREQYDATTERLAGALKSAKERVNATEEEAARVRVLLEAVRAAPSRALAESLKPFHRRGLSIHLNDAGGCDVQIDGRPWGAASEGRRIAADMAFRGVLRKLTGLARFPMVVDSVQSWSGHMPQPGDKVNGPVVTLRTVPA